MAIFTEGLDGHSLATTYYFKEEVTKLIGEYTDHKKASILLKDLAGKGDKIAKKLRQGSKPVTFGISYGAYPAKVAQSIGCSIEEATVIWNAYHEEMFPDINKFKDEVVAKVNEQDYSHLGLGCRIYSNDTGKHNRTLFNANSQFWSILTLLVINKMHTLIDEAGYTENIKCISTIYDSIYFTVTEDIEIVKWLNDTLIKVMNVDYLEDQIVPNAAESDLGYDWSTMVTIQNNASTKEIKEALNKLKGKV